MDSAKLNDWMQVVGIFAVVASLIFVGLQMIQDRKIALAGQYQERSAMAVEYWNGLAQDGTAKKCPLLAASGHWAKLAEKVR